MYTNKYRESKNASKSVVYVDGTYQSEYPLVANSVCPAVRLSGGILFIPDFCFPSCHQFGTKPLIPILPTPISHLITAPITTVTTAIM